MENNTVKVKDLPRIEEILPGNLLIVEDEVGTKALDFQDFVVGPANTSFYNGLATNINKLSTYSTSLCATVANNINETVGAVRTEMFAITSNVAQRFPQLYVDYNDVTINTLASYVDFEFFSPTPTLRPGDFHIVRTETVVFTGTAITLSVKDPVLISPEGQPALYQYVCQLSSLAIPTAQNFQVKVQKFY